MYIQNISELIKWKGFGVPITIVIQSWFFAGTWRQIRSEKKSQKQMFIVYYCIH